MLGIRQWLASLPGIRNDQTPCGLIFPGDIVERNDSRYPTLVRGFNQRFVGTPDYIHLCGDLSQVLNAVQKAVDANKRITVRGGGHCYEDFVSGNHDGVIVDLSPLRSVYREGNLYCIEGGCTLWDVYTQLYREYGVTIPGGSCYSVGAGGHIIGGGYGLLSRKHGLTVDRLSAVEVVHVDHNGKARLVSVNRDSTHPAEQNLFWGHTGGGGGNFGIVTKYWFKDPPQAPEYAWVVSLAWNWADLQKAQFFELVRKYGDFFCHHSEPDSPYRDLFALLALNHKDSGQIAMTVQYVGDRPELMDEFIEAIRPDGVDFVPCQRGFAYHPMLATPSVQRVKLTWLEATQNLNVSGPTRRGKYKSAYMIEPFPETQLEVMWDYLTTPRYGDLPNALLQVDSYGCQINAVAADATAVPQRSSILKLQYQVYWVHQKEDERHLQWIRDFYQQMYGPKGPYPDGLVDGCYVNYPDVDLVDWQYLYYKEGYSRLQQVKQRWDPLNIFNHAQSIELP